MGWALGYFYGNLGWDWGYLYGNFTSANKGLLCGHDFIGYRASLGYGACGLPQNPCNQALVYGACGVPQNPCNQVLCSVTKDEESRLWSLHQGSSGS